MAGRLGLESIAPVRACCPAHRPILADSARGREALRGLDFFVQADLFMAPTAELADICCR